MNVVGRTGIFRKWSWEGFRWFPPGIFLAATVISVLCYVGDVCSDEIFIEILKQEDGMTWGNALNYYLSSTRIFLSIVNLCCAAFVAAGLYAQDYEENTVYMRVQRMGIKQYAGLRVMQVSVVSWFLGCISILLMIPTVALIFHVPMLPVDLEMLKEDPSPLLASGHVLSFVAALGVLAGFRSLFYSLLAFVISFFVPHRRVLPAIPMLLWYFNQYALSWVDWIPWFLQPGIIFHLPYGMMYGGLPEWEVLGLIAVGMLVMILAVWGLFVLHLRRNGIFGGEQDE